MFKIVNLCDVVIYYRNFFQDKDGYWLECHGKFMENVCVCLDYLQLDLAGLYISNNDKPDISFMCQESYILALSDPSNNVSINKNITWCNDSFHIKNASSLKKAKIKSLHAITNYDLILILLCLYKANTEAKRGVVTEFYLASFPKAFVKYVNELANFVCLKIKENPEAFADEKSVTHSDLVKHVAMIERVLNVYADNSVRENLWTRAHLYDALTCYGFKHSLVKSPIQMDFLKDELENNRKKYSITSFSPDEFFLEKIHIIFKAVNTSQPIVLQNIRDISDKLMHLIEKSGDFTEKKIDILQQIKSLLK